MFVRGASLNTLTPHTELDVEWLVWNPWIAWRCHVYVKHKLQKVRNSASPFVFGFREQDLINHLLSFLHCLPILSRIHYIVRVPCSHFFAGFSLDYFSRPSQTIFVSRPYAHYPCHPKNHFSYCDTKQWNSPPIHICHLLTIESSKLESKHTFLEHSFLHLSTYQ